MKVTIITPATHDRAKFIERLAGIVASQDYPHIEWLVDYDGGTIGAKRNRLCEKAKGEAIVHLDTDDIVTPDWVSRSVESLLLSQASIVGLSSCYFHKVATNDVYLFERQPNTQLYLPEATLCYWRKTWERKQFPDTSKGEGIEFISNNGRLHAHGYIDGFLATIHGTNTCSHHSLPIMKKQPHLEAARLIEHFYG